MGRTLLLLAALGLALGCGGAPEGRDAVLEHRDPRFVLRASLDAELLVEVTPRAPWKLAVDFPVQLSAGDRPDAQRFDAAAAAHFDEDGLRYAVATGSAEHCRIAFGVCQGEICERVEHDFRLPAPSGSRR